MTIKDFGISLNFSNGTKINIDNSNNKLSLLKINDTYDGIHSVYKNKGTWTSGIIDLVDKYTDLGNLAINSMLPNSDVSYKVYTRTSPDSSSWDDYIEIDYSTGKMQSIARRYIQVKIELYSNEIDYQEVALTFNSIDVSRLTKSDYVTTGNNVLELKKRYDYKMVDDDGDKIYKTTVLSSKFKKIDRIRLVVDGKEV